MHSKLIGERFRNGGNNNNGGGRGSYRRYSRSRSRSRERGREQNYRNNRRNSRSRSRDRGYRNDNNNDNDLYRDIINQDYQEEKNYGSGGAGGGGGNGNGNSRGNSKFRSRGNDEDFGDERCDRYYERTRNRDRDRDYDNRDRRDRDRGDRDNKRYGGGGSSGGGGGGVGSVVGGGSGGGNGGNGGNNRRYNSSDRDHDRDSDDSDDAMSAQYYTVQSQTPSNTIIVLGLQSHITEADIMSLLIQAEMAPAAIRLIRKSTTGASRGFAFVEFNTTEEAAQWLEYSQGTLKLNETCWASMQYSLLKDWHCGKCGLFNFKRRGKCFKCHASRDECDPSASMDDDELLQGKGGKGNALNRSEWYCGKCNVFNFKRRDSCFKCFASRGDSAYGEGSDEISNILTKKIMLRNLDVLTNEEGVLTAITEHAPDLANKISKVFVSRDALTQTSRGICYLHFDSLVESMNMHNLLSTLEPPLTIDDKEVIITYCVDHENRQIVPKKKGDASSSNATTKSSAVIGPMTAAEVAAATSSTSSVASQYSLEDVPRLAEYSASVYATTPAEHAHYLQYYTEYYISEISSGCYTNLPSDNQVTEANSGAAVALSAIKRKQAKMNSIETTATAAATAAAAAAAAAKASRASVVTPKGNDGKVYPTPDVSLYQYDETSGYYYDPTTGLYYDAHSQYYYNNETGAYLYWDQRKSAYVLATPAAVAATVQASVKKESETTTSNAANEDDGVKKEKKEGGGGHKHDKVKVAKKIVKDMEKWAKQLNQKKDYIPVAAPQPIQTPGRMDDIMRPSTSSGASGSSGYADVGFSILEKKVGNKLAPNFMSPMTLSVANKLIPAYGSDSEEDVPPPPKANPMTEANEKDYVDFQKLTCLLCKRAFQSLEILQKHLKMSNLHKENLAKMNTGRGLGVGGGGSGAGLGGGGVGGGGGGGGGGGVVGSSNLSETDQELSLAAALSYRDRAKERRQKYGEYDPPPSNPSRERFEKEIKHLNSRSSEAAPVMPIGSNNVGNRLLQKMGWSEGQGLGRKNQGRTNIIEANTRSSTAGLGTKSGAGIGPGDDYKTYIKKMMKSRYESV